ncbi:uncharacterized protein LACBIDRAFT_321614 [Laccaria bicolor S238N-H82]|uniref:Predicted protein n=1 Tax=Laccaria bicolor (strain S238N-H82 / ATCC MYA-4686) TaxID=486041 RepID=B0CTJ4_LACBS|nr:uncharacterized protein LACBIDRAFT_321614 [Laccaria bicolor S238N-H82]EDR13934.1 predicted protein [Laccaria bicolor S238N-H82]|eukprot:XP_001874493.1 predicted protein [Laccaria bicolor S238N-H82]
MTLGDLDKQGDVIPGWNTLNTDLFKAACIQWRAGDDFHPFYGNVSDFALCWVHWYQILHWDVLAVMIESNHCGVTFMSQEFKQPVLISRDPMLGLGNFLKEHAMGRQFRQFELLLLQGGIKFHHHSIINYGYCGYRYNRAFYAVLTSQLKYHNVTL